MRRPASTVVGGRFLRRALEFASSPSGIAVLAIFAAGATLRIAFLVAYRPAFVGIPDSGAYISAAHYGLFNNVYDPAGYPLFIRMLHGIWPHLTLLIVVQHCLGLASAALLYLSVRHITGSTLLGLVPAALVLFDGFGLWVEHSPMTEPLFTFLLTSGLFLAIRALGGRLSLLAAGTALIALGGTVRPIGYGAAIAVALWAVWAFSSSWRTRLLAAMAALAPVVIVATAYALIQQSEIGFAGLSPDSGRVLYARAAVFADCTKFKPPAGTAALCETIPADKRGSWAQYLSGAPDRAREVTQAQRNLSPAWRVFGPPPGGNSKLMAFAIAAIVHQPSDYLSAVAKDFHYYWADSHRRFIEAAAHFDPGIDSNVTSYYHTGAGVATDGLGFLRWYGETIQLKGVLIIVLLLVPLAVVLPDDPRRRRATILFAFIGWLLPIGSVALASVDPRFVLPAYGPLAAAGAIGLAGPLPRRVLARVAIGRRLRPALRHP